MTALRVIVAGIVCCLAVLLAVPASTAATQGQPRMDEAGARAYQKCYACHALEAGKNDLTGPTLHAIVGRRVAAEPGFAYSPALRDFARRHPRWTAPLLDRMITDAEALVPGTAMNFHGIADPAERAALIAWLQRQR